jgi:hypothetical protein
MRKASLSLGIGMVILGLISLFVTGLAALVLQGAFHNLAANITVPTQAPIAIEVEPGETYTIARELAGPHITINRPILIPPPDLTITITDAVTNQPIATTPDDWWLAQNFFGLKRERRSIATFVAPDHRPEKTRVLVDIRGTFDHDQVYAVGPSAALYKKRYQIQLLIGVFASGFCILFGMGACIYRLSRPLSLDSDDGLLTP